MTPSKRPRLTFERRAFGYGDPQAPFELSQLYRDANPRTEMIVYDSGGHAPYPEFDPDAEAFLRRVHAAQSPGAAARL